MYSERVREKGFNALVNDGLCEDGMFNAKCLQYFGREG